MKKIIMIIFTGIMIMSLIGCNKKDNETQTNQDKTIHNAVAGTGDTIKVVKKENQDDNKFDKYLEKDERIIYLASNIEEVYYNDAKNKLSLKDYVSTMWQTTDDSINHLVRYLQLYGELNDGGTKIYKSLEFDITIVKCNKISGNKNIFIGDYNIQYDDNTMCKN